MKDDISALMDGELFEDEAESLFNEVRRDSTAHRDWATYHLIGDVLRQPECIHRDINVRVREQMKLEPTVLAPRNKGVQQKFKSIALSSAASLMALAVVAWMTFQIAPEKPQELAIQQNNVQPASLQIQAATDDYLSAHQEFSSSNDMNGDTSYIRTVSFSPEEKAK